MPLSPLHGLERIGAAFVDGEEGYVQPYDVGAHLAWDRARDRGAGRRRDAMEAGHA